MKQSITKEHSEISSCNVATSSDWLLSIAKRFSPDGLGLSGLLTCVLMVMSPALLILGINGIEVTFGCEIMWAKGLKTSSLIVLNGAVAMISIVAVPIVLSWRLDSEIKETLSVALGSHSELFSSPEHGLGVDSAGQRICVCRRDTERAVVTCVYDATEISKCDKLYDSASEVTTERKSGVAGAIVGAAMYGIPGAIAGGWLTSSREQQRTDYVENLRLIITTNKSVLHEIVFHAGRVDVSGMQHNAEFQKVERFATVINKLIVNNKNVKPTHQKGT